MTTSSVIVFGPTGGVGSVAARAAQEHGSKVFLAMRDPSKEIPGLSHEQEKEGGFERVQADLTKPDTISAAVEKTGAKRAFIYLAFGMPDSMKASITALKSAGIEYVVFLSSFSVQGDLHAIQPSQLIAFMHTQAEINLREIFGDSFVAVRPAYFNTNTVPSKKDINEGTLRLVGPDAEFDFIAPEDIGRVAAKFLARGPGDYATTDGQPFVNIVGPQMFSQRDGYTMIAKAIGKDLKIMSATEEEGLKANIEHGMPPPLAKYMVKILVQAGEGNNLMYSTEGAYDKAVGNIKKYTGRDSMQFQDWINQNKHLFSV